LSALIALAPAYDTGRCFSRRWKAFVVRADEKLTAFVELESAICVSGDAYSQFKWLESRYLRK